MKKAIITGVTGQDGAYLSQFLLDKGYQVHGLKRKSSTFNTERIEHLFNNKEIYGKNFYLHYGELTDSINLYKLITEIEPDEIYNLGAMSHVGTSFEMPEYTANINAIGTIRLLEIIRSLKWRDKIRFYQASSSEMFGKVQEIPQTETTPFYPRSPYAISKVFSYWACVNYRESYDIFASNGILFNHESPLRGETFVTRKITRGLCRIALGIEKCIYLGNLEALRDWGHARDFVEAQWLILQHSKPDDFVVSTGKQYSVRQFIEKVAEYLGVTLEWQGKLFNEKALVVKIENKDKVPAISIGDTIIRVSEKYFRPAEVDQLLGDYSKAKNILGWKPKISFGNLIKEMVDSDMKKTQRETI